MLTCPRLINVGDDVKHLQILEIAPWRFTESRVKYDGGDIKRLSGW